MSGVLNTLQANIEESRMAILGNDFAVILLVSLPSETGPEQIKAAVQAVLPDFVVSARPTMPSGSVSAFRSQPVRILRLAVEGPDQPVSTFRCC